MNSYAITHAIRESWLVNLGGLVDRESQIMNRLINYYGISLRIVWFSDSNFDINYLSFVKDGLYHSFIYFGHLMKLIYPRLDSITVNNRVLTEFINSSAICMSFTKSIKYTPWKQTDGLKLIMNGIKVQSYTNDYTCFDWALFF